MVKFDRIGYKLGLAGAIGVLLSVGMIANQMATESSVNAANERAEMQQGVADNALTAELGLREMMLGSRGIRLAKTPAEIGKGERELSQARSREEHGIDAALLLLGQAYTTSWTPACGNSLALDQIVHDGDWVAAVVQHDEECFMVTFRGSASDMDSFLQGLKK